MAYVQALAGQVSDYLSPVSGAFKPYVPNPHTLLQLPLLSSTLTRPLALERSRSSQLCPSGPTAELSCHNTSVVTDTCCFNAPGGQLLQTQFWDTDPATGPVDSWTIHGLW